MRASTAFVPQWKGARVGHKQSPGKAGFPRSRQSNGVRPMSSGRIPPLPAWPPYLCDPSLSCRSANRRYPPKPKIQMDPLTLFVVAGVQLLGCDRAGGSALAEPLPEGSDLGDRAPQEIDLGRDKLRRTLAEAGSALKRPIQASSSPTTSRDGLNRLSSQALLDKRVDPQAEIEAFPPHSVFACDSCPAPPFFGDAAPLASAAGPTAFKQFAEGAPHAELHGCPASRPALTYLARELRASQDIVAATSRLRPAEEPSQRAFRRDAGAVQPLSLRPPAPQ